MKTKIFNFKVKWLLVPLVLMFACGSAWADYTVTFKTVSTEETSTPTINKSNIIYSGGDYVNSISGASIFRSTSANGLKFGSNKNAGNVVLTMTSTGTIRQIQAAAIKFNGAKKTNGNLKYTITYTDNNTTTGTQTLTTTATDYTIDLTSTKICGILSLSIAISTFSFCPFFFIAKSASYSGHTSVGNHILYPKASNKG